MTTPTRAFFSFPEVTDPARHRDYNAWHQLDHRPENLALDGVLHGDRWVRTPQCRAASDCDLDPELSRAHYVAMYWFREPAEVSIEQWRELGTTTAEQGRRPELAWTIRRHTGFYRPVESMVSRHLPISAAAVPHRPHRGVVLEVLRCAETDDPVTDQALRDYRASLLDAVDQPGVIGIWGFASRGATRATAPGSTRITLTWCEDDPIDVIKRLPDPRRSPDRAGQSGAGQSEAGLATVLRTPLLTIQPHQWDWFDSPS